MTTLTQAQTAILDGTLTIMPRRLDQLTLNGKNPRTHSKRQIKQLARSIQAFGFNVPVLIDPSDRVIAGHARVLACRDLGWSVTILTGIRFAHAAVPWLVGLYITAAYWFTASTSFANPAVAIARSLTDTFSGIRPADLPGFIAAQLAGAVCALAFVTWLLRAPAGPVMPIRTEAQP